MFHLSRDIPYQAYELNTTQTNISKLLGIKVRKLQFTRKIHRQNKLIAKPIIKRSVVTLNETFHQESNMAKC